jgi:hypothetical protein
MLEQDSCRDRIGELKIEEFGGFIGSSGNGERQAQYEPRHYLLGVHRDGL